MHKYNRCSGHFPANSRELLTATIQTADSASSEWKVFFLPVGLINNTRGSERWLIHDGSRVVRLLRLHERKQQPTTGDSTGMYGRSSFGVYLLR